MAKIPVDKNSQENNVRGLPCLVHVQPFIGGEEIFCSIYGNIHILL